MNSYGVIATQKLSHDTFFRAIIAKGFTLNPNIYIYQCNRENINNVNIFGGFFDTQFYFFGDASLFLGLNALHDLRAHPYLGPDVDTDDSHNLGTILTYGVGVDVEHVASLALTLFVHTALSSPHANSLKDDYKITNGEGYTDALYATGGMVAKNGFSLYAGAQYKVFETVALGAEYNYGSKYWFAATQGSEDIYNKLANRGSVMEGYALWEFHKNLHLKTSYIYTKESYTGSGWHFGEPVQKNAIQRVASLSIKVKF